MKTLEAGAYVGRYRIEALLGKGGMGEVYRTFDEVLQRRVALKLLRSELGGDAAVSQQIGLILREARIAGALDHPNIVAIHDVGDHDGLPYIVMELVRGDSLRVHVRERDTAPSVRVGWLLDAARALSAAHRAGLVHRDVKPENIMVRDDGVVKVLDFGIARRDSAPASARAAAPGSKPQSSDATFEQGVFVGTPAYAAPEQFGEAEIDGRADQFAWGVVAYELLTGELPWGARGEMSDLLAAIILATPRPLDPTRLGVAPAFVAAVHRALAKTPGERFPSMDALLASIEGAPAPRPSFAPERPASNEIEQATVRLGATPATVVMPTVRDGVPAIRAPRRGLRGLTLGIAIVLTAALSYGLFTRLEPWRTARETSPVASAAAPLVPVFAPKNARRLTFQDGCDEYPSFLPDGHVMFDATAGHDTHVYSLDLATGDRRVITEGSGWQWAATLSPDGQRMAYLRTHGDDTTSEIAPISGGEPRMVAAGELLPSFSPDGRALWAGARTTAMRHDLASGTATRTLLPPAGLQFLALLELADGRVLASFCDMSSSLRGAGIYEALATSNPRMLWEAKVSTMTLVPGARWAALSADLPNGDRTLMGVPLDGSAPVPWSSRDVRPGVGFAISPAGDRMVWSTCKAQSQLAIVHSRSGERVPLHAQTEWLDRSPAWVPGTSNLVVISARAGGYELWIVDRAAKNPPRKLVPVKLGLESPSVSPSGDSVVFAVRGSGLSVASTDGSLAIRKLTTGAEDTQPTFSRDGSTVFFQTRGAGGIPRISAVPLAGGTPQVVREGALLPAASPAADLLFFLATEPDDGEGGIPTLLDLKTHRERTLLRERWHGDVLSSAFSHDGTAITLASSQKLLELDTTTGKILTRYNPGVSEIFGVTYMGNEILTAFHEWSGNLWLADDPFPGAHTTDGLDVTPRPASSMP